MKKKEALFWSDIKALDERLAKDPDSFCFSRLSEIYLKVGLVADALHTARTGVAKHPGYLAGKRALGMACNASGLHDECRVILEQVTAATPEDVDAQKILAKLYVAAGDQASAVRTYSTVLDFMPNDADSAAEMEALQQEGATYSSAYPTAGQSDANDDYRGAAGSDDEIIELSESDIFVEPSEEMMEVVTPPAGSGATIGHHDPLSTLTLAELYEQQGFSSKALEIYRTILADDPANPQILAKIAQLEGHEPVSENIHEDEAADEYDEELDYSEPVAVEDVPVALDTHIFEEASTDSGINDFEPELSATESCENVPTPFESQIFEPPAESAGVVFEPESELSVLKVQEELPTPLESQAFAPLAHQTADNVVDTLEVWLENIRRIKACR